MFYLIFLLVSFSIAYFALFLLFPAFFGAARGRAGGSLVSIAMIVGFLLVVLIVVSALPDREFGNRVRHTFGGGFLSFLICYRVVRDTGLRIARFQFFVFSLLVVTALGVGNEILEFLFSVWLGVNFAPNSTDTWLDLVSNTVGALIAAAIFVPLYRPDARRGRSGELR